MHRGGQQDDHQAHADGLQRLHGGQAIRRSPGLCMSGGYPPFRPRAGAMSTNQPANPRWRVDERDLVRIFSIPQLWNHIRAGQRAKVTVQQQVVHTLSPGPATATRVSSTSGPELSPVPVESRLSERPPEHLDSPLGRLVRATWGPWWGPSHHAPASARDAAAITVGGHP